MTKVKNMIILLTCWYPIYYSIFAMFYFLGNFNAPHEILMLGHILFTMGFIAIFVWLWSSNDTKRNKWIWTVFLLIAAYIALPILWVKKARKWA